jgi:hypothetical protein
MEPMPEASTIKLFTLVIYTMAHKACEFVTVIVYKLQITGQNLDRVFNSRSGRVHAIQFHFSETEQPNLKFKTRLKQPLGSLPLDIALPATIHSHPSLIYVCLVV